MTTITRIPTETTLAVGDHLNRNHFHWVTAAQAGTEHSLRAVDDDRLLASIVVVESAGRRLAVSTDTHRIHAAVVAERLRCGVYLPHGDGYQRDQQLSANEYFYQQVRQTLDRLQLPDHPHTLKLRIARHNREPLLELLDRHPDSVVAFRTQSITVHDWHTDELLGRIPRARGLTDKLRRHKLVTVRASVLRRPVADRVLVFTGTDQVAPVIGHRQNRAAVLMPCRPSTGASILWDSAGAPVGPKPEDGET